MPEPKTRPGAGDPVAFVAAVENPTRRADAQALLRLMGDATGRPPVMWGPSIVGYGRYRYRYATGRTGEMCAVGFSPRAANLVLYGVAAGPEAAPLLERLGKHRTGAACLYVNRLADVDLGVLRDLVAAGYRHVMECLHVPEGA